MNAKVLLAILFTLGFFATQAQEWITNIDEAKKLATSQERTIILVFQGSDWCVPCMKLERSIWNSEDFQAYAADHFVMLKADFPRKKENALSKEQEAHNKKLAERYNQKGFFPLVVILNAEGKVLGETGYKKMTPQEYIDHLNTFLEVAP